MQLFNSNQSVYVLSKQFKVLQCEWCSLEHDIKLKNTAVKGKNSVEDGRFMFLLKFVIFIL